MGRELSFNLAAVVNYTFAFDHVTLKKRCNKIIERGFIVITWCTYLYKECRSFLTIFHHRHTPSQKFPQERILLLHKKTCRSENMCFLMNTRVETRRHWKVERVHYNLLLYENKKKIGIKTNSC